MKGTVVWDMTACGPIEVHGRFGGTYCLDLQSRSSYFLAAAFWLLA
jgi:hypothetical protein